VERERDVVLELRVRDHLGKRSERSALSSFPRGPKRITEGPSLSLLCRARVTQPPHSGP